MESKVAWPASYTKLSTYETCPAKYNFRYNQHLRGAKSTHANRGDDVHKSIEDFLLGKSTKLHDVVEPYRHIFRALRRKDPFIEHQLVCSEGFLRPLAWESRDKWFVMKLDAAYIEGNRVEMQEWKTGKVWPDHDEQRKLYILGGRVQWPAAQVYRIQTYYFDQGTKKVLEMEKDDLDDVRADFVARIGIMGRDDILAPRPGPYCGWCDYSKVKGGPCRKG